LIFNSFSVVFSCAMVTSMCAQAALGPSAFSCLLRGRRELILVGLKLIRIFSIDQ
jgi:hypothetical protein